MRIRKQYQVIPTNALLEDGDSTSATNGYTADYINNHSVIVSPTEPTGSARKKVWKQHSSNLYKGADLQVSQLTDVFSIPLEQNTDYTISYNKSRISGVTIGNPSVYDFNYIRFYNASGTLISQLTNTLYSLPAGSTIEIEKSFTTPANTSYASFVLANNNGDNNVNTLVSNIMINKGSTALPYEPYVEDKEYILNNDVYEEYTPQNEVYSTEEVRIGTYLGKPLYRKVFTGTCRTDTNYIDLLTNVGTWFVEGGLIYETAEITRAYDYYFTQGQGNLDFDLVCGAGNLRFRARGTQIQGKNYMIIINYTKTTD